MVDITDAQVDEALARLTAQYKAWEPKDGKAAKGDKVTIGFVGKVDGKAFDGGTAEDVPLELGSGQFIPGFEDQLIGAQGRRRADREGDVPGHLWRQGTGGQASRIRREGGHRRRRRRKAPSTTSSPRKWALRIWAS